MVVEDERTESQHPDYILETAFLRKQVALLWGLVL